MLHCSQKGLRQRRCANHAWSVQHAATESENLKTLQISFFAQGGHFVKVSKRRENEYSTSLFLIVESSQTIHRVPSDYDFPPPVPQPKASQNKASGGGGNQVTPASPASSNQHAQPASSSTHSHHHSSKLPAEPPKPRFVTVGFHTGIVFGVSRSTYAPACAAVKE